PESLRSQAVWLNLDEGTLDRKIAAALSYDELHDEVQAAIDRFGRRAFAVECLRPVTTPMALASFERELPAYERYGEFRVKQRRYTDVIRYREHVLPVRDAIQKAVEDDG